MGVRDEVDDKLGVAAVLTPAADDELGVAAVLTEAADDELGVAVVLTEAADTDESNEDINEGVANFTIPRMLS